MHFLYPIPHPHHPILTSSCLFMKEQQAMKGSFTYQKPLKSSMRPPLIPNEDEQEKQEESFLGSLGRLVAQTGESAAEILGGVFPIFKKKQLNPGYQSQNQYQQIKYPNTWPVQESYVIPDEDEPPPSITPKKTYAFMTKDSEKMQQLRQSRAFYSKWEGGDLQTTTKKQHQHHHQYQSSPSQTYYEQSSEKTNEVVFGAVQEKPKDNVVIKPLDHGIPLYDHQTIRSRFSYNHGR